MIPNDNTIQNITKICQKSSESRGAALAHMNGNLGKNQNSENIET